MTAYSELLTFHFEVKSVGLFMALISMHFVQCCPLVGLMHSLLAL